MTEFRTSYAYPWALIRRGGTHPSGRPFTRMAFITEAVAREGRIIGFKALIGNESLTGLTRHARAVAPDEIVKEWRTAPSRKAIRGAKARLAKVQP